MPDNSNHFQHTKTENYSQILENAVPNHFVINIIFKLKSHYVFVFFFEWEGWKNKKK